MAPTHSRQLLVWTLPTIAVLLSYLWYKRKRIGAQSDPGDDSSATSKAISTEVKREEEEADQNCFKHSTPNKNFSRSLSGVESSPIDIVIPPQLRATKSTPIVISDEDLDYEIEKIKSMRNGPLFGSKPDSPPQKPHSPKSNTPSPKSKTPSPKSKTPSPKSKTPSPVKEVIPKLSLKSKNNVSKRESEQMAQKDMAVVEEKLTSLRLNTGKKDTPKKREQKNSPNGKNEKDLQRQSSERDSANHSPSDVMLVSPSLSSISDNHSEGSSDSGKGGSDVATPPPSRTPGIDVSDSMIQSFYEFVIPQNLVGKLIGRHGSFVTQIKDQTNAMIIVKMHPTNAKMKICSVEGTKQDIENALKMVRDKFPAKRYPELTLEQVHLTPIISTIPLIPDHLYLKLVEGINNDTILSCMVTPNHLFLQQPTHPSFPSLNMLASYMNACYNAAESPLLPTPIPQNTICSAYSVDSWYRAMVLSTDEETDTSYVKFLDYGGFAYVENAKLRQIRGDFMLLPFQAAECMLANVKSLNEDGSWPEEAYNLVADITKGAIIYTQIADFTEDGIPLVLCYVVVGPASVVFLNQHLVDNGFADWVPIEDEPLQTAVTEGAVGEEVTALSTQA